MITQLNFLCKEKSVGYHYGETQYPKLESSFNKSTKGWMTKFRTCQRTISDAIKKAFRVSIVKCCTISSFFEWRERLVREDKSGFVSALIELFSFDSSWELLKRRFKLMTSQAPYRIISPRRHLHVWKLWVHLHCSQKLLLFVCLLSIKSKILQFWQRNYHVLITQNLIIAKFSSNK